MAHFEVYYNEALDKAPLSNIVYDTFCVDATMEDIPSRDQRLLDTKQK